MVQRLAEMGRKLSLTAMEEQMQLADGLISQGVTRANAAKHVGLSERSFYRYYHKWHQTNAEKLKDNLAQYVMLFLGRQDRLYKLAFQAGQLRVAAKINNQTFERLQSMGIIPKVK